MFFRKRLIKISSILFLLSGAFAQQQSEFIERQKYIMGTYITIKLPPQNEDLFKPAFDIFKQLDQKLSIYKEDSEINKINKNGCSLVSDDTLILIKKAVDICRETEGYFNVAIGKITYDLFGFGTQRQKIPSERELERYSKDIKCSVISIKGKKVCISKGFKIDTGGIAKGYAVDKVADFLKKNNVKSGAVLASGDIRCISSCDVLIKNPFKKGVIIKLSLKEDTSISTSGNYERFIKDKRFNHLINPKTGKPQQIFASVTLLSKSDNTLVDAYSTALSVMPLKKAVEFLKTHKNIAGILITNNKKVYITKNIYYFSSIVLFFEEIPVEVID